MCFCIFGGGKTVSAKASMSPVVRELLKDRGLARQILRGVISREPFVVAGYRFSSVRPR